jgi:hypothetical protein
LWAKSKQKANNGLIFSQKSSKTVNYSTKNLITITFCNAQNVMIISTNVKIILTFCATLKGVMLPVKRVCLWYISIVRIWFQQLFCHRNKKLFLRILIFWCKPFQVRAARKIYRISIIDGTSFFCRGRVRGHCLQCNNRSSFWPTSPSLRPLLIINNSELNYPSIFLICPPPIFYIQTTCKMVSITLVGNKYKTINP